MITEYANSYYTLGSIEGITIAIFFGGVGIASLLPLSPIVGAFAIWNGCSEYSIKQVEIGNNKGKGNIQNIFI